MFVVYCQENWTLRSILCNLVPIFGFAIYCFCQMSYIDIHFIVLDRLELIISMYFTGRVGSSLTKICMTKYSIGI